MHQQNKEETGKHIEGRIESLAFGGAGILRHQGQVFFVPFTAPGDLITAEITSIKKSHGFAKLIKVIEPGKNRIVPRCPYFGACGGCQLQHLDYSAQLEYKRQAVEDALIRIGRLPINAPISITPAEPIWHYRRHIQLNLRSTAAGLEIGYVSTDQQSIISILQCSIFTNENDPLFADLRKIFLPFQGPAGRVSIFKLQSEGYLAYFHFEKPLKAEQLAIFNEAIHWSSFKTIGLSAPAMKKWFGNEKIALEMDGLQVNISPQAFVQNHAQQSSNIYRKISTLLSKENGVIDAYCGIGISSLLLARNGCQIIGIESNPQAVQQAKENAKKNGISHLSFVCAKTEDVLKELLASGRYRYLLVNPPKTGLHPEAAEAILQALPQEILYISCMPATLARDLKKLSAHYDIVECQAFDMFPQTAHVETLVHLKQVT